MGQLIVGELDDEVIEKLKKRAEGNNRTLEGELRDILMAASRQLSIRDARALADRLRKSIEGRAIAP